MALETDKRWKMFLFSSIGSVSAEAATVPIDVVKVRLQLQGELGAVRQYNGILDAFVKIVKSEGIGALYKGISPALLRQSTYGGARIGLYEPVKALMTPAEAKRRGEVPFFTKIASGVTCGALASGLFNPCDVVKVRMQADGMGAAKGTPARYSGLVNAFTTIGRTEGLGGLYKGVSPTMQRASIVAAVELATYDECKMFLINRMSLRESSVITHFSASLMAGFMATIASSPADVIKTRVMSQPVGPDGRGLHYSSTVDCLRKTVAAEGALSLWKGFLPNFGRLGPHTVIMFLVIEQLRKFFG